MGLSSSVIKTGVTSFTVTGGTQIMLTSVENNGVLNKLVESSAVNYLQRRSIDFTVKEAKVSAGAPNGYTQPRRKMVMRFPRVLANSKLTVDTLSIELATDVEATLTEKGGYLDAACSALTDANVRSFFKDGNTT